MTERQIKNFWAKVKVGKPDECWEWQANKQRYGRLRLNDKNPLAHRVSWLIHFGEIPQGMCVLHKCDNPPCVNPNHLWLGTQDDNMKDMANKGKRKGIPTHIKLSKKDREQIKILYWINSLTQEKIAKLFGVSNGTIAHLLSGISWRDVS